MFVVCSLCTCFLLLWLPYGVINYNNNNNNNNISIYMHKAVSPVKWLLNDVLMLFSCNWCIMCRLVPRRLCFVSKRCFSTWCKCQWHRQIAVIGKHVDNECWHGSDITVAMPTNCQQSAASARQLAAWSFTCRRPCAWLWQQRLDHSYIVSLIHMVLTDLSCDKHKIYTHI